MVELLPCPFCGGEAYAVQNDGWYVACGYCEEVFLGVDIKDGFGMYKSEEIVVKHWNSRLIAKNESQ